MENKKKSKVHGSGIFASQNIPRNTKIIQYIGGKNFKVRGNLIEDPKRE